MQVMESSGDQRTLQLTVGLYMGLAKKDTSVGSTSNGTLKANVRTISDSTFSTLTDPMLLAILAF